MTIPAEFVAAWTRTELVLDGTPMDGAGRAIWIQGSTIYVDVRAPDGSRSGTAFAGRTTWEPGALTWHHDLDQSTDSGVDSGRVRRDGPDLIEEGENTFGARAYFERWHRLDGGGPTHEAIGPNFIALRSGRHAAAVADMRPGDGFAACYWQRTGNMWAPTICIGDIRLLPQPADLPGEQPALDTVVDALRATIATGCFAQGHHLSEERLAAELSTTLDMVREALRILGSEGAVQLRHGASVSRWVVS